MPKSPAKKLKEYHLIIKDIKDFDDGLTIINKLPSVGISVIFGSFELGADGDNPHIHLYCTGLYTRRYYTDHIHEVFLNKFIMKLVKNSVEDHEKLISYILKDGKTYIEHLLDNHQPPIQYVSDPDAIYKPHNIEENINIFDLFHKENPDVLRPNYTIVSYSLKASRKPTKTYTQKLCQHFLDNKNEIYRKHPFTDLELENHEVAERTIDEVMDYTNLTCKSIDTVIVNRFTFTVLNHIPEYRHKLKKSVSKQLKYNYF